jgi:hypothetical protein
VLADALPTTADGGIMTAISVVFTLLSAWSARRLWRGPHRVLDAAHVPAQPFGPAYSHGVTRCLPLIAAFTATVLLPVSLGLAVRGGLGVALAMIAALEAVLLIPALLGVFFLNRPRWCVPPHRRDEPGALAEFRGEAWQKLLDWRGRSAYRP